MPFDNRVARPDSTSQGWRQFSDRNRYSEVNEGATSPTTPKRKNRARIPLLAFGGLLVLGILLIPRAQAAWQLNHLGSVYADYGLCMAGPTGPELLFAKPGEYLKLLRRRMIASRPDTRPFSRCKGLAAEISGDAKFLTAHDEQAKAFAEFSGQGSPVQSIRRLDLNLRLLKRLKNDGGFLITKSLSEIVKPSRHAKEAIHPPAPPEPGLGFGLRPGAGPIKNSAAFGNHIVVSMSKGQSSKTFISENKGVSFRQATSLKSNTLASSCVAREGSRSYSLAPNLRGESVIVYRETEKRPRFAPLLKEGELLRALACDRYGLVALVGKRGDADDPASRLSLRECKFGKTCINLPPPTPGALVLRMPAGVERIDGDTIISLVSKGVVRVSSSRDSGSHWMPWVVAYDSIEAPKTATPPYQLLRVGTQLLLYGDPDTRGQYLLLLSADHGASFRGPKELKENFAMNSGHQ